MLPAFLFLPLNQNAYYGHVQCIWRLAVLQFLNGTVSNISPCLSQEGVSKCDLRKMTATLPLMPENLCKQQVPLSLPEKEAPVMTMLWQKDIGHGCYWRVCLAIPHPYATLVHWGKGTKYPRYTKAEQLLRAMLLLLLQLPYKRPCYC